MNIKPLFSENDPLENWKLYNWELNAFLKLCQFAFEDARSNKDHLTWILVSELNQNLPEKISEVSNKLLISPNDAVLIAEKATLEARLSNLKRAETRLNESMVSGKTKLTKLYFEHQNNLIIYKHKAQQEIDHLDANGNLGAIQRIVYPTALSLYKSMNSFLSLLENLRSETRDRYEGFRNSVLEEFNSFGHKMLHSIIETYKIEKEDNNVKKESETLDFDGLDLDRQKDQIRLLYELGIINHLREKYPSLKQSNNALSNVVAIILKYQQNSLQPTINALVNNNGESKNYPYKSKITSEIINRLNATESN